MENYENSGKYGLPLTPTSPPPSYGFQAQMPPPNTANTAVTQQPQVIFVNQVAARHAPGFGLGKTGIPFNQYQVGLCDCCHSCQNLFLCMVCPCYLTGKITSRLEEHCCYANCFGILPLSVRFRSLAGIHESMCSEGCHFLWCYGCSVLRLANEMEERDFTMSRS